MSRPDQDPLDEAIDHACAALADVARIAELRGALSLSRLADLTVHCLLDDWEAVE